MNLKIQFKGLEELKKRFSEIENPEQKLAKSSNSILNFHKELEKRVQTLFYAPSSLESVRIGRTVPLDRVGRTLLRFSLQYRYKAIPLNQYPYKENKSSSYSSAPTRKASKDGLGYVKWKRGQYSKDYPVAIRKNKYKQQGIAGKGSKGGYAFKTPNGHLVRRKRQTWHIRPSFGVLGIRSKLQLMYGPSLSQLAASVLEKDTYMQNEFERLIDDMMDSLL